MDTTTDDRNENERPADSNPFEQGTGDPVGSGTVETPNVDGGRPDGDPEAVADSDRDRLQDGDPLEAARESKETVTNDAVAGETVLDGAGDGNYGPTGGSPREAEPIQGDPDEENIDLGTDIRDVNER
jgi:hypothetical protein